jgi:hypothetical protein
VTPFTGDRIGADDDPAIDDDTATNPGAEDHPEDACASRCGAVARLGQRKAIGVIGEAHRTPERRFEVAAERAADQPGRVGVLDEAGARDERPRNTDPDRRAAAELRFDAVHQGRHRRDRAGIVARRGRDPPARMEAAISVDGRGFDLGAAEIDADAKTLRS